MSEANSNLSSGEATPEQVTESAPVGVDDDAAAFWRCGIDLNSIAIHVRPPDAPLQILESLGPSPFERTGFPLMGFLATAYEKVSRYALERGQSCRTPPVDERA